MEALESPAETCATALLAKDPSLAARTASILRVFGLTKRFAAEPPRIERATGDSSVAPTELGIFTAMATDPPRPVKGPSEQEARAMIAMGMRREAAAARVAQRRMISPWKWLPEYYHAFSPFPCGRNERGAI